MFAEFNRFTIRLTRTQAGACSHQGQCDAEVADALKMPGIKKQLDAINPEAIRDELREYGAWDAAELADDAANRARIVWIAAGNINEDN